MTDGIWRFGVLGPLLIEHKGEQIPLASSRQRELLALLLMSAGVPLSRDRLINELWGDDPPATAVSAIHVHLSKLRTLLDGLLVLEPAGYLLSPDGFELDTQRLDSLLERAGSAPLRAGSLLKQALDLFRGEPLCDALTDGAVTRWARSLNERRLRATLERVDVELAAGHASEVLTLLEDLAEEHPFDEQVWAQLMLALYRCGRQADALCAYQRARRRLADDLGLEPGERLAQLQRQVLEHDPALLLAHVGSTNPRAAAPDSNRGNIPRPLTRLVGREQELATLADLLVDPETRMITLRGPGGVGKTRLLLEVAHHGAADYADGAVFVGLEHVTDADRVYTEIAAALAHRDGSDGPSADALIAHLRDREMLLAIDNFEQLLDAAPAISTLLAAAPMARVIVTSRAALRIRGEQTLEVDPLSLPADGTEQQAAQSPAVQLFLQCALRANRKLTVDASTTVTAAKICRALDGLPLAIELAASRSHSLTLDQIAAELSRPLSIGGASLRDLPDRHRTLDATIRWSYEMLSPCAQNVLRCASVFLGSLSRSGIEGIVGLPLAAQLEELVEAGLLRRHAETRYRLLELVRVFAREELEAVSGAGEARMRHCAYFATYVADANRAFDAGDAPGEIATSLIEDHANLRAAFDQALETGDEPAAAALALGLRPLWLAGMLRQESQDVTDRLLDRFPVSGVDEVALLRAVAFLEYGPSANVRHRQLANRAREIGDMDVVTTATGNIFGHALNTHDREEMLRLRPELIALLTPETSTRSSGWIHYYLALDAYVNEDLDSACSHASLAVELAAEAGHEFMHAGSIGALLLSESARDGQIKHSSLTQAVEVMRRPGVQPLTAFALWLLARFAAVSSPEMAGQWLVHADRIVTELGSDLWPECELRDETMMILGFTDLASLRADVAPRLHTLVLEDALAWLAGRDHAETSQRAIISRTVCAPD